MNTQHAFQTPAAGDTLTEACKGLLFVLVGPSGVGKNAIMQGAIAAVSRLRQMPTATTRAIRTTEQHGREHFFMNAETFQQMIQAQAFVEYQEVDPGKFYGTPRREIEHALLEGGELLIADIDVHGAEKLKAAFPTNVVIIYIQPPDLDALNERLHQRGGMSEEEIQMRLERGVRELAFIDQADHRVTNHTLEQAISEVTRIIQDTARQHDCI